ncbi:MAG TPA: hypothetical protein VFE78_26955, partial [Gemmataceae bacterium]|nr:hypothetical protein [Gemmataceae bacterium]
IRNYLGPEPDGALLTYRGFPNELGAYYEVVYQYDDAKPQSKEYAFHCEHAVPATWADGSVRPPVRTGNGECSRVDRGGID